MVIGGVKLKEQMEQFQNLERQVIIVFNYDLCD